MNFNQRSMWNFESRVVCELGVLDKQSCTKRRAADWLIGEFLTSMRVIAASSRIIINLIFRHTKWSVIYNLIKVILCLFTSFQIKPLLKSNRHHSLCDDFINIVF